MRQQQPECEKNKRNRWLPTKLIRVQKKVKHSSLYQFCKLKFPQFIKSKQPDLSYSSKIYKADAAAKITQNVPEFLTKILNQPQI